MVAGVGISDRLESDQPYIWYVSARYRSLVSVPGQAVFRRSADRDSTVPRGAVRATSPCVPLRYRGGRFHFHVSQTGFLLDRRAARFPYCSRFRRCGAGEDAAAAGARRDPELRHATRGSRGRARATSSIRNNAQEEQEEPGRGPGNYVRGTVVAGRTAGASSPRSVLQRVIGNKKNVNVYTDDTGSRRTHAEQRPATRRVPRPGAMPGAEASSDTHGVSSEALSFSVRACVSLHPLARRGVRARARHFFWSVLKAHNTLNSSELRRREALRAFRPIRLHVNTLHPLATQPTHERTRRLSK